MNKLFKVSPSPHLHEGDTTRKLMTGVIIALLPALLTSVIYFGYTAIIVTLVTVASCVLFEYLIQRFLLNKPVSVTDGSAVVTGLLLAFNLPPNIPVFIIVIGDRKSVV